MAKGDCAVKNENKDQGAGDEEPKVKALSEAEIALLKTYGMGPYATKIKQLENDLKDKLKKVNELSGIKESDTGLAPPSRWDLVSDRQMMQEEHPLQVSRCTKIIDPGMLLGCAECGDPRLSRFLS